MKKRTINFGIPTPKPYEDSLWLRAFTNELPLTFHAHPDFVFPYVSEAPYNHFPAFREILDELLINSDQFSDYDLYFMQDSGKQVTDEFRAFLNGNDPSDISYFDFDVTHSNYNSQDDFGVILKSVDIGSPEAKSIFLDVPLGNGSLDLTNYYGKTRYNDREISMDFLIPWWSNKSHFDVYSKMASVLNGQRVRVTLSSDEDWYYDARLTFGNLHVDGGFWGFSVKGTAAPYKMRNEFTVYNFDGDGTFECVNAMKDVIPVIFNQSDITLTVRRDFYFDKFDLYAGMQRNTSIIFEQGINLVRIESSSPAKTTILYKEGVI